MKIEELSPTLEEYMALRESIGRWQTEEMPTKNALSNLLYSVVALDNNNVVGNIGKKEAGYLAKKERSSVFSATQLFTRQQGKRKECILIKKY